MGDQTGDGESTAIGPGADRLTQYFEQYGGTAEQVDESSVQSTLSDGKREYPIIVTIDGPDYVYFRLFLFSNTELGEDTDYLRLLQISDRASVVKLAVDNAQELVACVEYPLQLFDYDLFELTINIFFGFIESFYGMISEVVDS